MKKKSYKKTKIIHSGVYPYDILYTVGTTEKEVAEYLHKKCSYRLSEDDIKVMNFKGCKGKTIRLENNAYILWTKDSGLPVLGHEIFHVAELIMEKINVPLNEHTSEPYAYLIEHLWREVTL